jgi:hypothetical protein
VGTGVRRGPLFVGGGLTLSGPLSVGGGLTFAKLWLVDGQQLAVFASLRVDDALFLRKAHALWAGEWLGPYDQLTLAKQPLYPVFIALARWLHVPLLTAQHVLFAAACAMVVVACGRLVVSPWRRVALFGVLLFEPMSFHTAVVARVDRAGITPALTLLLLAALIGLAGAAIDGRHRVAWSAATGLAFAALWLTREEGVMLVPAVVVGVVGAGWAACRKRNGGRQLTAAQRIAAVAALGLLPILVPVVATAVVRGVNHERYGVATVNEVHAGAFPAAFGALLRVEADGAVARFPLAADVRRRIAAVSPAFAELEPWMEGPAADRWRFDRPDGVSDIAGLALQWVVRDAAASAGHHRHATEAVAFYDRLAGEIDAACSSSALRCGPSFAGTLPRPRVVTVWAASRRAVRGLWDTVSIRSLPVGAAAGDGTAEQRAAVAAMTGEAVAPSPNAQSGSPRITLMRLVVLLGLVAGAWRLVLRVRSRSWRGSDAPLWVASVGVPLVVVLTRTAGLAYIDITMYPGFDPPYIAPSYTAVVMAVAVVLLADGRPAAGHAGG